MLMRRRRRKKLRVVDYEGPTIPHEQQVLAKVGRLLSPRNLQQLQPVLSPPGLPPLREEEDAQ